MTEHEQKRVVDFLSDLKVLRYKSAEICRILKNNKKFVCASVDSERAVRKAVVDGIRMLGYVYCLNEAIDNIFERCNLED